MSLRNLFRYLFPHSSYRYRNRYRDRHLIFEPYCQAIDFDPDIDFYIQHRR